MSYKVKSMADRMNISAEKAQDLVRERQGQRDAFLKDFLGRDIAEPTLYHLVFNNARLPAGRMAELMAEVVLPAQGGQATP
jgi:cytidylate kinase